MDIYDKDGNLRDEAWLAKVYGPVKVEGASSRYRVKELRDIEGPTAFEVRVLKLDGSPVIGEPVIFTWGDSGGPDTQHTDADGMASHTAGGGAYYQHPEPGPHREEVDGLKITGLGWLWGSNHRHLNATFIETDGESPPEPPEPPEPPDDELTQLWARLFAYLERIIELLEGCECSP